MKAILQKYIWPSAIILSGFLAAGNVFSAEYIDPLQEIAKNFPDSIRVKNGISTIEFCPDNTCDAFAAKRQNSSEGLKEFAYLYVFFYSDYYVLDNWRNKETAKAIVKHTLSKPQYQSCNKASEEDAAQCILIQLGRREQIKLMAVRYNERKRNVVKRDLGAVLAKVPVTQRK